MASRLALVAGALAALVACDAQPLCNHGERFALQQLFRDTTANLVGWQQPWDLATDPCRGLWTGVVCDGSGHIVELSLANNHLAGTLSASTFALLTHLRVFSLPGNRIVGTLPDALERLTGLRTLDVSGNFLTGEVPSFSAMPLLERLHLHANTGLGGRVHAKDGLQVTVQGSNVVIDRGERDL
jgi:hypothetical protein